MTVPLFSRAVGQVYCRVWLVPPIVDPCSVFALFLYELLVGRRVLSPVAGMTNSSTVYP